MTASNTDDALNRLSDLIAKAKAAGADAADAILVGGQSLSVGYRMGKLEHLERSEDADVGLRVLVGKRQAMVSSSDVSDAALEQLVERAVAMARETPEDPYCGIADPDQIAAALTAERLAMLDMYDHSEPDPEHLKTMALTAEDAARAVTGVTNSEGAEASWGTSSVALAASNGFAGGYSISRHGLSVSVIGGEGTAMETDYDYTAAVHASDLESPEHVGQTAGEKVVRRLNPRKAETGTFSIILDPRVSRSIPSHLIGAINGASVARGTSFLKDKMGETILPKGMNVIDDPHRPRGLRTKPFDAEGLPNQRRAIVEDGELKTWILDLATARQLGLTSTAHASRGTGGPPSPSPTNLYLEAGSLSPDELMADIASGFYITDMMGFGVNGVTGDYSRGATGFWIRDGKLAESVSEVTVAGNLKNMFLNLTAASDLTLRYGMDAPTLRIDGMTVAGQ